MLMRRLFLFAAIAVTTHVATSSVVRAETFEQYVAQLGSTPAGTSTWLEGCQVLITPRGEARTPCMLTHADLVGGVANASLKAVQVTITNIPNTSLAWREATVHMTVDKKVVCQFSVVEVGHRTDAKVNVRWVVTAQIWRKLQPDAVVSAKGKVGKIAKPVVPNYQQPGDASDPDPESQADLRRLSDDVRAQVSIDIKAGLAKNIATGATLFGSAGERLKGQAGAKTLRKWTVSFAQEGNIASGGDADAQWAVTQVNGSANNGIIPYWLFVVMLRGRIGVANSAAS